MTLRLDTGAASSIAAGHTTAADTIDGSATTAPAGVDAGIGTRQVLDILAACSGTAADLAAVNHGVAAVVRQVGSDLGASDDVVADGFARMGAELR